MLAAARGRDNARIAADLGISIDTARRWRGRFAARRLDGLNDLPRSGRPRRISAAERAAVVALACQLPAATGVPLSRWTGPELAAELAARGLPGPLSVSSILRIHPGDHRDQAVHEPHRPGHEPARIRQRAPGVRHRGQRLGHRGQAAIDRLAKAHPNAIMIHTPVHASWLNQIGIFFSIIQKKVVSPNDFAGLDELSRTLLAFVDRYNQTARPFNWKFTASDLTGLLRRISEHEQPAQPAVLPQAA